MAVGFIPNDREAIRGSIQGLHAMAATLLSAPILLLSDSNAKNLTERLSDVLDYHKINITGGGGPWGLYLALAMCGYGIYKPMLDGLANGTAQTLEGVSASATPGDAANRNVKGMDFGADIIPGADKTVSEVMDEPQSEGIFKYG